MTKFLNYFRIESTRLPNWHYAAPGNYFVTVCTKNRKHFFGKIENGILQLNALGNEVVNQWVSTPAIRPDMNISLDTFQVMPNHFHGIIKIGWNKYNHKNLFPVRNLPCRDGKPAVSTWQIADNDLCNINHPNKFGPQRKNLGSVMRGFKSSVTMYARENKILFDWHPRYFDVVIRNDLMLKRIRNYIHNNVKNWNRDRFNKY